MPRNLPAVEQLAALDGVVYFAGRDEGHGQELWQSDGTPQGTKLVKDLNPGKGSSFPSYLVAAGSKLFFFASDLEGGFQLWTSDGTAAGTVPVRVIGDGRRESVRFKPMVAGGKIFIITIGARHEDSRLWASDGTADGTRLLPLPEATAASLRSISPMIAGNDLYFVSEGNLWRSDGTPEGTTVAMAFGGNGFQVWNAVEAGGRIYLSGQNEEHGLRRFDPASGQLEVPEF